MHQLLTELHFGIIFCPGQLNDVPDAFSRFTYSPRPDDNVDPDKKGLSMFRSDELVAIPIEGSPLMEAPIEKEVQNGAHSR